MTEPDETKAAAITDIAEHLDNLSSKEWGACAR
jgi:hypothetical protein